MKLEVRKSSKISIRYLLMSIGFGGYFAYAFFSNDQQLAKTKSLDLIGISLFFFIATYCVYRLFDKRPILILNDKSLYLIRDGREYEWKLFKSFEFKTIYGRNVTSYRIHFYDISDEEILKLDINDIDCSRERLIGSIRKKVKEINRK